MLLPEALPAGGGPLVDHAHTSSASSTISNAPRITRVTAAPAGALEPTALGPPGSPRSAISPEPITLPRSVHPVAVAPAATPPPDAAYPSSTGSSASSGTVSSGVTDGRVVSVAPERNLYGIRRPVSPASSPMAAASSPRAASPAWVASGDGAASPGTQGRRHK